MSNHTVIINSRKFDGRIHRTWSAELIEKNENLLSFVGVFTEEVNHPDLGLIRPGTISYEYYWIDRWYNVFKFYEPEGRLRNYYCNINLPPSFQNNVLDFIDLDVDLLVWSDFTWQRLDLEEFEKNTSLYGYSEEIVRQVSATVAELEEMIRKRVFPFQI